MVLSTQSHTSHALYSLPAGSQGGAKHFGKCLKYELQPWPHLFLLVSSLAMLTSSMRAHHCLLFMLLSVSVYQKMKRARSAISQSIQIKSSTRRQLTTADKHGVICPVSLVTKGVYFTMNRGLELHDDDPNLSIPYLIIDTTVSITTSFVRLSRI